MVSLEVIQASNAKVSSLESGLVAVFLGATQGIGQSTLDHLSKHAPPSSRIYTVARPSSLASHEAHVASLRKINTSGTYQVIEADVSLITEVDRVVQAIKEKESKVDILVLTAGFIAYDGRKDTSEGLDPSMTTRYYSRLRAVQQLLPLLDNAAHPRVLSVLAAGKEGPINEEDLDLRTPENWTPWSSSVQATTLHTLALERFAHLNPKVSIAHWYPGFVDTVLLARAKASGMDIGEAPTMSVDESGARCLFYATSGLYAVRDGLVPAPEGVAAVEKSGGGIFQLGVQGEYVENEKVLAGLRERGVDETAWKFAEGVYEAASAS